MPPDSVESLIAQIDWSATELGPRERGPQSLRTALGICLRARFPAVVYWGSSFVQLYNDAAGAIFGDRHPAALGQPAQHSWPDLWASFGTQLTGVKTAGVPAVVDNWLVPPLHGGLPAEMYFTSSCSPIEDGGGIGGVFGLTELFHRPVEGEQQLRALLADESIFRNEHPARALKAAFFDGAQANDDVAILIVDIESFPDACAGAPAIQHWTFDAHEEAAARAARREIGEALSARGGAFEDVYAAELVFGELVGNAVRHAPGRVEVTVDWSASAPRYST